MSEELKKRLQSLAWRVGMMALVAVSAFLVENATSLQIPAWGVVFLGLVGGEVSKYLNTAPPIEAQ